MTDRPACPSHVRNLPRYLRVVTTTKCPMSCPFCHHEGFTGVGADRHGRGGQWACGDEGTPSRRQWLAMLDVAVAAGIRKFKLLGGEPLYCRDLPAMIAHIKARRPDADVSIITSGAAPRENLEACFGNGLDRANLSIHGWGLAAFMANGAPALHRMREETIDLLAAKGRPLKLNYVYTGPAVEDDLADFLAAVAAGRFGTNAVASILDDLGNRDMSAETIRGLLVRLCGRPARVWTDHDPDSLPAERWGWDNGLVVEIKSSSLGRSAPWAACANCDRKDECREGTMALRLDPDGYLRPCLFRRDLGFSLLAACENGQGLGMWRQRINTAFIGPDTAIQAAA